MTASCTHARLVDLHFSLRIAPEGERALRAHLGGCDACRGRYRRQLLLARLDPGAASAQERLGRGLGLRSPARRRHWLALIGATAAAAAALAFWPRADADFTPRGTPASLPAVVVYRIDGGGSAQPAGRAIAPSDELAFAYRNPQGRKFILVFGVDEHQHVYWYHPAWTDAAQDPAAVPIRAGADLTELSEAIAHPIDGTRLTIRAVLLDRPVRVREVEDRLARGSTPLFADAHEESLVLEVRR